MISTLCTSKMCVPVRNVVYVMALQLINIALGFERSLTNFVPFGHHLSETLVHQAVRALTLATNKQRVVQRLSQRPSLVLMSLISIILHWYCLNLLVPVSVIFSTKRLLADYFLHALMLLKYTRARGAHFPQCWQKKILPYSTHQC